MRKKAFTLIELLVVIAIIAVLMAILMPALRKASEQARKIVCQNNLKTIALGDQMYANDSDDWHVPILDGTKEGDPLWFENTLFSKIIAMKGRYKTEGDTAKTLPKDYKCPTDRRTVANGGLYVGDGIPKGVSYAMNAECLYGLGRTWYRYSPGPGLAHCLKTLQVVNPADKIFFIDGQWFAVCYAGSDYKKVWDITGDKMTAKEWDTAAYRHSEGANIAFYDGHVKWLPKQKIWPQVPEHYPNKKEQWRAHKALWYPRDQDQLPPP
jgi:prepilin-type N-terminal cleavage/methylation domain-containing protein/prepilin-type processing-associated H-X9-DG protein